MSRAKGEMPFLDHLEELRSRIVYSLIGLIVGVALCFWISQSLGLIPILVAPIVPYLPKQPDGTPGILTVLRITDAVMFKLKLGLLIGLVLASPVILWQVWAFLSPALYAREKKAII